MEILKESTGRRQFLTLGGVAIAGAALFGKAMASATPSVSMRNFGSDEVLREGIQAVRGGLKPVYLPADGNSDAAAWSLAENLFWSDIMAEHALFMALFMPTEELTELRNKSMEFHRSFASHFNLLRTVEMDDYVNLNKQSTELVLPLLTFKKEALRLQSSGKIHTLAMPTLIEHLIDEAQHFINRLAMLSRGSVSLDRNATFAFWVETMGEHAQFIDQMLDPSEVAHRRTAQEFVARFAALRGHPERLNDAIDATKEIAAFKTAAAEGIIAGTIKSMILPALADHVRREAVRAHWELTFVAS